MRGPSGPSISMYPSFVGKWPRVRHSLLHAFHLPFAKVCKDCRHIRCALLIGLENWAAIHSLALALWEMEKQVRPEKRRLEGNSLHTRNPPKHPIEKEMLLDHPGSMLDERPIESEKDTRALLWMDEILHHPNNHRMMIPLVNTNKQWFQTLNPSGANWIPSIHSWDPIDQTRGISKRLQSQRGPQPALPGQEAVETKPERFFGEGNDNTRSSFFCFFLFYC